MDRDVQEQHLRRVNDNAARGAYKLLVEGLEAAGLDASPNTGHVSAVRFHNAQNDYLLSFIVNQTDLLSYLRKPLLTHARDLSRVAFDNHRHDVRINNAEETTIRIRSVPDAERLLSWLVPRLAPFL